MKVTLLLMCSLLLFLGCDSSGSNTDASDQVASAIFDGIYSQAMEHQGFTKIGSSETWWVDGEVDILNVVSLTPLPDGGLLMEGKARVKLRGELSELGSYGHFGMFTRELRVLEVIECIPLSGGPSMEEAKAMMIQTSE